MAQEQQYWLPGYGLSRHIVLGHIHYFLGPSASARPYSYQVSWMLLTLIFCQQPELHASDLIISHIFSFSFCQH